MGDMIRVEGVVKDYDARTRALDGVSLTIREGEWTAIMGPSGSGKTTLLNIMSCLDSPTEGRVVLAGTIVTGLAEKELTRFRCQNIGLIFQMYHLVPYLTALENVMLAQYYSGTVDEAQARRVLDEVGLGHRTGHVPAHLSGGEQQRVCIARALINAPRIIMADEPTGNLDAANGRRVLELIRKLKEDGHTVVMVTHSQNVAALADRVIELVDGKVVSDAASPGRTGAPAAAGAVSIS
ncbi:MAG: ABC transporter ATP-binding protein [Euryarchaeota archaeon]|nr:ABC transporter ATP-binding protein [Euryarchaeota archaeon]